MHLISDCAQVVVEDDQVLTYMRVGITITQWITGVDLQAVLAGHR